MANTTDSRTRLRRLGQLDLGDWIGVATGEALWTIQKRIATALSEPSARVAVPSCVASGKTFLAARLALAFFDAFTPGTPCHICDGPCGGAKILTTSSKWEHLRDNLWGEIRMAVPKVAGRVGFDGQLPPSDLYLKHLPNHLIVGQVATAEESIQGMHAAHVLVIGDEATSISEEVAKGITGVLASGDARMLLIFNPTTADTFAAQQTRANRTTTIRITAFDTPGFTGEPAPEGAALINHLFLADLQEQGMGPGTYEWTTRVCAEFWDLTDDTLIAGPWYEAALRAPAIPDLRAIGIDIAPYGSSESGMALRDGNALVGLQVHPSGRVDHFFQGPVTTLVREFQPHYVIYDADGVGAGAVGYAEALTRHMPEGGRVIGFRGAKKINDAYTNARSAWYWHLRRILQAEEAAVTVTDPKLKDQLTTIRYSIVNGAIRVETKDEMRKRGFQSPDRADMMMYAFAYSGQLAMPVVRRENVADDLGLRDNSERAMWERDLKRKDEADYHPMLGYDW